MNRSLMVVISALVASGLSAVETKRVIVETYSDWRKGEADGALIGEDGFVAAGGRFSVMSNLVLSGVEAIWSVADDGAGGALLGTGPKGWILRADGTGKVSGVAKLPGANVYAVAAGPDGAVYASCSPDAKVYRCEGGKEPEVYYEPGEKHVWALLWAGKELYVATGNRGRLFKVIEKGKGSVAYDGEESNLRCLALDRDGRVLVGSEGRGLLLRLEGDGKAFALFDSGRGEVRQIAVDEAGHIAFVAGGKADSGSKKASSVAAPVVIALKAAEPSSGGEPKKEEGAKDAAAPAPKVETSPSATPSGGGDLWLLVEPGFARRLWSGSEFPQSLARHGGEWIVGTGGDGRVFRVSDDGRERIVAKLESKDVTALLVTGNTLWAGGSNEAAWLKFGSAGKSGWYRSEVIDGGTLSDWGSARVEGEGVAVRTRSGNTRDPDGTWGEWQPMSGGKVTSRAARYLQFELRFEPAGRARRAEVFYTPRNLPPEVGKIVILAPGEGYEPAPRATMPPPSRSVSQIASAKKDPLSDVGDEARFTRIERRSYRTLVWTASDPNDDKLEYRVGWRPRGKGGFMDFDKPLDRPILSFDTSGWADGGYEFRVTASDRHSNPGAALSGERISELVLIDNRPPQIVGLQMEGTNAAFRVEDAASVLTSVTVSADGLEFDPVLPIDGVLDSLVEEFRVPAPGGRLFIRARDEAANEAGASVAK
ncbi:MAG TPA: hypothetical protein PLU30_15800 [Verrucomicrobiae bacterium]|nr:hypothetical protein [Verrucomicrobiae bacterium]